MADSKTKRKRLILAAIMVPVTVIGCLFAVRAYNARRFHLEKETRFMMDTFVTVYAVGPKEKTVRAIGAALDRMQAIDHKFSMHNSKSPVYAFNHDGTPIDDPEIMEVVKLALEIGEKTGRAFDITISPLIELWGFYGDTFNLPGDGEIEERLRQIGMRHLVIRDGKLWKTKDDIRIDLGGIAKGYCVRKAANVLKDNGVVSALIDAGGDVFALGKKGNGLWKVGIRSPRQEELLGYVEVSDLAVMGSGDYERFFIRDGKRYHHILDPRTGRPASELTGVTLFHPDPAAADAWCTAVFVLGPEKGMKIVEKTPGMETIMVIANGQKIFSSGLKDRLKNILEN